MSVFHSTPYSEQSHASLKRIRNAKKKLVTMFRLIAAIAIVIAITLGIPGALGYDPAAIASLSFSAVALAALIFSNALRGDVQAIELELRRHRGRNS